MSTLRYPLTILSDAHSVPQGPFPDLRAPPVELSLLLLLGVPASLSEPWEDEGRDWERRKKEEETTSSHVRRTTLHPCG